MNSPLNTSLVVLAAIEPSTFELLDTLAKVVGGAVVGVIGAVSIAILKGKQEHKAARRNRCYQIVESAAADCSILMGEVWISLGNLSAFFENKYLTDTAEADLINASTKVMNLFQGLEGIEGKISLINAFDASMHSKAMRMSILNISQLIARRLDAEKAALKHVHDTMFEGPHSTVPKEVLIAERNKYLADSGLDLVSEFSEELAKLRKSQTELQASFSKYFHKI